jgi:hypothetical protein
MHASSTPPTAPFVCYITRPSTDRLASPVTHGHDDRCEGAEDDDRLDRGALERHHVGVYVEKKNSRHHPVGAQLLPFERIYLQTSPTPEYPVRRGRARGVPMTYT